MAAHPAEHAQQDATLRTMALGTLILNAFSVRAAPGRFIRCRCSAIQNHAQTNTYDPDRPERLSSLLSRRRSQTLVGALVPAVVMSGVVDSGRESGHGNIDANDPNRKWRLITLLRNDDLNRTVLIPLAECGWRVRAPNFHQNRLS
jgi:hypothetical protein